MASRHWPFLVSLFLHLIFFILVKIPHSIEQSPASEPVDIEFVSAPIETESKNNEQIAPIPSAQAKRPPSLSELIPQYKMLPRGKPTPQAPSPPHPDEYSQYTHKGAFDVANSMSVEDYSPMIPYFEALWRKIDERLDYPEDFAKQRISGSVQIHLQTDAKGVFFGDFLQVTSSDLLLQSYVMTLIAHTLKDPLPSKKWLPEGGKTTLALSFQFKSYSVDIAPSENTGFHMKNALHFHRERFVDPRLNEMIEEFFTKYVPPIIAIPGGVYIDFVMAYKMIRGWGKPTERELRKRRIQNLREQLQKTVSQEKMFREEMLGRDKQ